MPKSLISLIIKCTFICFRYAQRNEIPQPLTLVQMQINLQDDLNKKLTFNPHYFSASYVVGGYVLCSELD